MEIVIRLLRMPLFYGGCILGIVGFFVWGDALSSILAIEWGITLPTISSPAAAQDSHDASYFLMRKALGQTMVGTTYANIQYGTKGIASFDGVISVTDPDSVAILMEQMRRMRDGSLGGFLATTRQPKEAILTYRARMESLIQKANRLTIGLDLAIINMKGEFYQAQHQQREADRDTTHATITDNEPMLASSTSFSQRFGADVDDLRADVATRGKLRENLVAMVGDLEQRKTYLAKNFRLLVRNPTEYDTYFAPQ